MNNGVLWDWLAKEEDRLRLEFKALPKAPNKAWLAEGNRLFQFYAVHGLDINPPSRDVDRVILAVGSNFTQRPNDKTKEHKLLIDLKRSGPDSVIDQLSKERTNALHALAVCRDNLADWRQRDWCSKPAPELSDPESFVFIMTNLCPWIPVSTWSEMDPKDTRALLAASNGYAHVQGVLKYLRAATRRVLVIAHGCNDNIKVDLLDFMQKHVVQDWFFYANLSLSKKWDRAKGQFC
jgi:hypothetical protein